jgi:hypothetical protein
VRWGALAGSRWARDDVGRLPGACGAMTAERTRPALRALRREPALIDDRLVAERLAERPELSPEAARWARAWLVCWQAALVADDRYGLDEPWEIPLALRRVVVPRGGGDAARRERVLEALASAGLVTVFPAPSVGHSAARTGARTARVGRDAFVDHPAAMGVDWPGVVAVCAEPAPLLVLRALAELALPGDALGDAFTSVPRRDLMAATGYQHKQVRLAIRRLVALGLLDVEGDTGTTARYRLSPRAVGQPWRAAPVRPAAGPAAVAAPPASSGSAAPTETPPAGAAATDREGLEVTLGGVAITVAPGGGFEIGPGMVGRVERGPDGRPRLVVRLGD